MRGVGKFLYKHSGIILTTLGVAGVAATAVVATKQGKKIKEKEQKIKKKRPKADEKEILEETWTEYVPTVAVATGTILCIVSLYLTDKKKQAALISLCVWTRTQLDKWREKVRERDYDTYVEVDEEIKRETRNDRRDPFKGKTKKAHKNSTNEIAKTDIHYGEPVLAYDEIGEEFFETSLEDLLDERYQINRHFIVNDYTSVNDYRMYLGLRELDWGWGVGWSQYIGETHYGYRWIDLELVPCVNEEGRKYYSIHFPFAPHKDFLDDDLAASNYDAL
jgi:hypothetical protein